jgi:hypothetical protein
MNATAADPFTHNRRPTIDDQHRIASTTHRILVNDRG